MGFFSIFEDTPRRRATDKGRLAQFIDAAQWVLGYIGVAALAVVLFVGAGKWTGRWEVMVIKERLPKPADCGSCRKGDNVTKGTKK